MDRKTVTTTKHEIIKSLSQIIRQMTNDIELLSIVGSYDDTLNDEEILSLLLEYESTGRSLYAKN